MGGDTLPVFISYNKADRDFAENLALNLVQAKQNVWIDKWELNAGDSLISKIEEALGDANAILVLLSKDSVESEWCKKELRAGLIRELEEKSVLLIPIILDDCEIPLLLKEKSCIDFREDIDGSFNFLLRSLSRISNPAQARAEISNFYTDWAIEVASYGDELGIEWTFVNHGKSFRYVVLIQVIYWPTGNMQTLFSELPTDIDRFVFASNSMNLFLDDEPEISFLITSSQLLRREQVFVDEFHGESVNITITVRRLGEDNGMDTIVRVEDNLRLAVNHTLGAVRQSTT
ncbi:MAG: toll/interleukin-1 receptor domain-containing protein [Candidatus Dadabacteria bacterium]|nr:toll/interleukin-1 receptor domain-containing protein [Candidatus Dadabacteria bacterium]